LISYSCADPAMAEWSVLGRRTGTCQRHAAFTTRSILGASAAVLTSGPVGRQERGLFKWSIRKPCRTRAPATLSIATRLTETPKRFCTEHKPLILRVSLRR